MEIKELVPKLVEHYQRCIDEMPEVRWWEYLRQNKIEDGICWCSIAFFDIDIVGSVFIDNFTERRPYYAKIPQMAESYSEAKELLQIRLNRLKDFL